MVNLQFKGMLLASAGIGVLSFDALLVRLADADASVIAFYRGLFMGVIMLFVWLIKGEKDVIPRAKKELFIILTIALISGIGTSLFVFSVKYTVAANTVVFLATSSFFGAVFSYLILKEKIKKATAVAIGVSFLGVVIIFGNSFSIGGNLLGDFLGILLAVFMGLQLTLLRKFTHFSHYFIISASGFFLMFIMYFIADDVFDISSKSLFWLFLMGLMQVVAMFLIYGSTKFISSAEIGVFSTIETTFAPVWLWLFIGEIPPSLTFIGGVFVISAIFINAYPQIKKRTK
ncbi:MAG TPA: DMT family transporter [Sulfurospirillum arcachonense]|nr:DMT family transporter [Sulfurospirillum arcachonense]